MRAASASPVANRAATTATVICACVMQGLDTTIVNVCLPHIQGSMSAAQDQISWVLTSYIVASAIMMPLTGWLAGHFGVKYIFLGSVVGFTFASALCGAATSLTQLVLYRILQGVFSAGLVPLGQATLFTIYPREKHGQAMAIFSTGAMMGPIVGPTLGGWLTENLDWRWCFYINLPVGALCALGVFVCIRQTRTMRRDPFDGFGFAMLSLGVGALQLMLDRGQLKDWFHSTEIWVEAAIAGLCFYLLAVHTMTTGERSFLNRELLRSPNFVAGSLLMFGVGMILSGTLALMPSMMQVLMNYPVFDAGWMMAPRGFGTMLAMFIVARIIDRVDNRIFILVGFLLTAASLWQMTGFSLYMDAGPILFAGFAQGFGLGCTFVPLNLLALSGLPHHILAQGTAIRALARMLGGSIGIAILETELSQNTQIVHSRLMEHLRPDNPLAQPPYLSAPFSLTDPTGIAALNQEVTRQAAMIAYNDDFALMLIVILVSLPLLLLVRGRRRQPVPAAADD
jgi:MFS transporter, DHA2 family, multidrug resistance protein